MMGELSAIEVRARVLAWYDANRRDLPWHRTADPYRILVAEYLLQRTRIVSGTPYYERFVARFPSIQDLAAASLDSVLAVWEGLGFYRRARNLHAAARAIVERHGGQLPESFEELAALPGMGPYTAGAVASIAFGIPVPAVDGNVTRAAAQRRIREIAASLVSPERPGAFNQSMMELGATVCTPSSPSCARCPLERLCLAHLAGEEDRFPVSRRARASPLVPVVFGLVAADGRILLVRRPSGQLLGGLWSLPGGERARKDERAALADAVRRQAGIEVDIGARWSRVSRTFSHRRWFGSIYRCTPRRMPEPSDSVRWVLREEALRLPLVPFHREAIEALAGLESFERAD